MLIFFNFYSFKTGPDNATVLRPENFVPSNDGTCQSTSKTRRCRAKRTSYFEEEEGFDVEFDADFSGPESHDEAQGQNEDCHPDFQSPDVSSKRRRKRGRRKNSPDVEHEDARLKAEVKTPHIYLVEGQESAEVCVKKEEDDDAKVSALCIHGTP